MKVEKIPWHLLNVERRALSTYDEWHEPTREYVAKYRSNNGLWRLTRILKAPSLELARDAALAAIPKRKPTDIFWLTLHSLALKE